MIYLFKIVERQRPLDLQTESELCLKLGGGNKFTENPENDSETFDTMKGKFKKEGINSCMLNAAQGWDFEKSIL